MKIFTALFTREELRAHLLQAGECDQPYRTESYMIVFCTLHHVTS